MIYETRCMTCQERREAEIDEMFEDEKEKRAEMEKIKIFKYIGETSKSCFERGLQHLADVEQLKPSSHILKHFLDIHENENLEDLRFGRRIRSTAKSAFERQITESVHIQQECYSLC